MLSRLRDVKGLNIPRPGMLRAERNQACVHFGRDVKGLNIPQHRDVKGYMIANIPLLSPRSVLSLLQSPPEGSMPKYGVYLDSKNFEVLKNREDSSDFDDSWTV